MSYSLCACSLEQLLALSVSWLKYPIDNISNHVFESGLKLLTSSNSVVSVRPSHPGTWFSLMTACRTVKYQNSRPTWFSVINAHDICIIVRHVLSANPFEDWWPSGAAIMLEPFDSIHRRAFPSINFLSKSEWNLWGKRPASSLNSSNANVMDVYDNYNIPHIQQYLVATSTNIRAYLCPPEAIQSPKTMSIWTLSRNWRRFLMGFNLGGLAIVAKEPIVDGIRP